MSRRVKPLVVVLLLLILLLAFGIYRSMSAMMHDAGGELTIHDTGGERSYAVYLDEQTGLYGVRDSTGSVRIAPAWEQLTRVSPACYIAGSTIDKALLYCLLDLDEKLMIPQVYAKITPLGSGVLAAQLAADHTFLLYNRSGTLLFPESWENYTIQGSTLRLFAAGLNCTGEIESNTVRLTSLRVTVPLLDKKLTMAFSGDTLAQTADYDLLRRVVTLSATYLRAVVIDDYVDLLPLSAPGAYSDVTQNGLLRKCMYRDVVPTGFSTAGDAAQPVYQADFLLQYARVVTPATSEQPAVVETLTRTLRLELISGADNTLLLLRSVCGEEQVISET